MEEDKKGGRMIFAQIIKEKANLIVCELDKVEELRNAGIEIIDISKLEKKPKTGWEYDSEKKVFIEPKPELELEELKATPKEVAQETLENVSTEELDKTDIGRGVKALLQNAGLMSN